MFGCWSSLREWNHFAELFEHHSEQEQTQRSF